MGRSSVTTTVPPGGMVSIRSHDWRVIGPDDWPDIGRQHHEGYPPVGEILLVANVTVGRDQFAVCQTRPAHLIGGTNLVPTNQMAQRRRNILIKQDAVHGDEQTQ